MVFGKKTEETPGDVKERAMNVIVPGADVVEKIINPDELIEKIGAYLRGEVIQKMPDGTLKREKVASPRMNEKGIQQILMIMRSRLSEIYRISNFKEDFVRFEVFFFNNNLIDILAKKEKEWEIDSSYYNETIDYLVSAFESITRMSINANTIQMLLGIIPYQEKKEVKLWPF